jgi:hypothetical protein
MKVRVMKLEQFWETYAKNRDLIDRCFHYLLQSRFPNPDGEQDAYSTLLMRMYELDVFNKFDPKKIVAKKRGICKNQANAAVSDEEVSDEALKAMGIDIKKKFEQFVFKYIEHILQEAYMQRKKQAHRYLRYREMVERPPQESSEMWGRLHESPWAQTCEQLEDLDDHIMRKEKYGQAKCYPTFRDIGDFVGSKHEDALDKVLSDEIVSKFRGLLRNEKERKVYDMTLEGISNSDIATAIDCTPQNVNILVKKIRERFERFMQNTKIAA